MNKILFITALVFFTACSKERKVFSIKTIDLGVENRINDIYFLNDSKGFAVGGSRYDEGYIFLTEDAGETWSRIQDSEINTNSGVSMQTLNSIDFLNDSIGEIVGHGGKILRTDNGGKNWDLIRHGSWENFKDVKLFSENESLIISGGAYGGGYYFHSNNLWFNFDVKEEIYAIRDLEFLDNNIGYSVGYGYVQKTIDGGTSWELLDLKDDYFFDLDFPTKSTGYICGWQGGIYKTKDSGNNWENVHPVNQAFSERNHFENIDFLDENTGVVCGYKGIVLYTKNGGKTWFTIETNTKSNFHSIYFLNEHTVFVGGENGFFIELSL